MMATPFLIQQIPSNAKFVDQYSFVECYPIGKNDDGTDRFDLRRLLNEIQVVDPRLSLEELDRIDPPDPDIASLFDIADMQLSSRGADALCSFRYSRAGGPQEETNRFMDGRGETIWKGFGVGYISIGRTSRIRRSGSMSPMICGTNCTKKSYSSRKMSIR